MLPAIWHRYIFLFGLIGLAAGMLFGTVPTSIPQIILAANWLLEKNFEWKWKQLRSNKIFWVIISLYILHIIGMFYTQNVGKGLDDLRNKLPLLVLPLILFSTKPLDKKEFKLLFNFFFLSVLISSICCFLVYKGYTKKTIVDVRQASVFMSHIRFSLFIAFSIIGLVYYSLKEQTIARWVYGLMVIWLLYFMYKLEMATGFLCLTSAVVLLLLLYSLKHLSKKVSILITILLTVGSAFLLYNLFSSINMYEKNESLSSNRLLQKTLNNRNYYSDTISKLSENGTQIFININEEELKKEWQARSFFTTDTLDKKGNTIYYTILRYLASKGLTKDSIGITALTKQDIENIENGNTNFMFNINSGLSLKWRELVWEYTKYTNGGNPSGHSVSMRLEFWKTASYIIYEHPYFGVGTGDIQDSFNEMYIKTKSKLDSIWRLRCHNQYLAICVAFGFVGLLLFAFYLLYPAIVLRKELHYLYWSFYLIALLSFITEDTLETQSGVTFFIFFQTLFLWLASFSEKQKSA